MAALKIALCVPAYGIVHARWVQCLTAMIRHTLKADLLDAEGVPLDVEIETFIVSSSMLCESRHRLCAEAALWGADHLLFMDADHVFPADILCRLWSRGLDIVGVNYARRCEPTAPTAARSGGPGDPRNLVYTTQEKAEDGLVEPVAHLGFGMVLIRMAVFDRLQAAAEAQGLATFMPLFLFGLKEDGMSMIGEDVYFFAKCRAAGIAVHVDHAASWGFGHLHETIVTNAHAVVQAEAWTAGAGDFARRLQDAEGAAA